MCSGIQVPGGERGCSSRDRSKVQQLIIPGSGLRPQPSCRYRFGPVNPGIGKRVGGRRASQHKGVAEMKIIVFGATGRVGSSVVDQSLKAGDDVTVFVRDRNKVKSIADKVSIVEGDALNELRVLAALAPGFDAVIFAIGASALKPSTLVTDSMRTVVSAMKKGKVSRLLGVSGVAEMPNQ